MAEEKVHVPFKLKNGECYSIIRPDDAVVGIFISNGIVNNYPNGDSKGNIEYRVHACLFETGHILKPVILSGPDINGYGGVQYPRECGVRYSTDKEKDLLLKKLRLKKFKWDTENLCIVKQDKKGNNG